MNGKTALLLRYNTLWFQHLSAAQRRAIYKASKRKWTRTPWRKRARVRLAMMSKITQRRKATQ